MYSTFGNTGSNPWTCLTLNMTEDKSCECGCDQLDIKECIGNKLMYNHESCECECTNNKEKYSCPSPNGRRKIWKPAPECRCECHPSEFKECSTGNDSFLGMVFLIT